MNLEIYETGPMPVNTYILEDEESREAVIIDLGGSYKEIKKNLDEKGYTIKYVLNTHGHFDHVLGESELQQTSPDIPIYMHNGDISHFKRLKEEMTYFGFEYTDKEFTPTKYIDENEKLTIGKQEIKALYTPGHSKGSMSYYVDGKVFSGDVLFYNSIGRTDFYDADYDTLINSIKTKLFSLPDETIVYPGHGRPSSISHEKKYNHYLI